MSEYIAEETPPTQTLLTEDRYCPGCKKSVVDENGGVVVAFGQSFFHVDCFKCAKCGNQVTADTNLLLLSDGSPICANCSYSCNVCKQPILDEAIMTGEDSYHAHCFKCKVCKNRIDELVFAKTSQGIYCMNCHNERVARSRRHQARKQEREREKERERERAAAAQQQLQQQQQQNPQQQPQPQQKQQQQQQQQQTGSQGSLNGRQGDKRESQNGRPANAGNGNTEQGRRSSQPTSAEASSPDTSQYNGSLSRSSSNRATESADGHSAGPSSAHASRRVSALPSLVATESQHRQQELAAGGVVAGSPTTSQGYLGSPVDRASGPLSKRHSGMFIGLPTSPSMNRASSNPKRPSTAGSSATNSPIDQFRSPTSSGSNMQTLLVPQESGSSLIRSKRASFDGRVRPLNVLRQVASSASLNTNASSQGFTKSQNNGAPTDYGRSFSSNSVSGRESPRPHSPIQDYYNSYATSNPSDSDYQESPISPPNGRSRSSYDIDSGRAGRARSASSSAYMPETAPAAAAPTVRGPRPILNLERVPARSTSLGIPTSFEALEAESPSNLVLDRGTPDPSPSKSKWDDDSPEEREWKRGSGSVPPSPSHFVDVPRGVESGTDTESDHESGSVEADSRPPSLPPKEHRHRQRPEDLRVDVSQRSFTPAGESEGTPESSPVERTSHATFIAPALPPIRISMGGGDFEDFIKTMGSSGNGKGALDGIGNGHGQDKGKQRGRDNKLNIDLTLTPPDSAGVPTTPKSDITVLGPVGYAVDETPMRLVDRGDRGDRSDATSPSSSSEHEYFDRPGPRLEPGRRAGTPPLNVVGLGPVRRKRERGNSNPAVNGNETARITVTAPNDEGEALRRRLQDAVGTATERGAGHVTLDVGLVQTLLGVFDQQMSEYASLRQNLDGMKRASKQYIDGLTVAQTEYDCELKARRDAEAEVTRLRVLLSGQAVRLTAISGDSKRQEAQKQHAQDLNNQMSTLERDVSKLKVERDMTLAEVEQLSASRSGSAIIDTEEGGASLSRGLSMRLDNIKVQYQHELIPLTEQRETLQREIAELKASRDAILEETTVLNKRNEELAQLNAQYQRRLEQAALNKDENVLQERRNGSFDRARSPPMLNNSVSSTTLALSEESTDTKFIKISKPDVQDAPVQQQARPRFIKWPGSRAPKENILVMNGADGGRAKWRTEHVFQQMSVLRVARCDHCGDKMWGSQFRCTNCNIAVHTRCIHSVNLACSQQAMPLRDEPQAPLAPLPPSMFGRDLVEQVQADSRDDHRMIPVIVEKCIDAVDSIALDYEGIYRKTGGSSQSKMITQLFERGDYTSFDLRDSDRFNDICSVTSVLKAYFRALPNPLLTFSLHDKFVSASTIRDVDVKATTFLDLIHDLPAEHFYTLRALMLHLHRVCERSERNLMHARNLGVVFGPTLMRSPDPGAEFSDMAGKALCVEWLIENAQLLFDTQLPAQ